MVTLITIKAITYIFLSYKHMVCDLFTGFLPCIIWHLCLSSVWLDCEVDCIAIEQSFPPPPSPWRFNTLAATWFGVFRNEAGLGLVTGMYLTWHTHIRHSVSSKQESCGRQEVFIRMVSSEFSGVPVCERVQVFVSVCVCVCVGLWATLCVSGWPVSIVGRC